MFIILAFDFHPLFINYRFERYFLIFIIQRILFLLSKIKISIYVTGADFNVLCTLWLRLTNWSWDWGRIGTVLVLKYSKVHVLNSESK